MPGMGERQASGVEQGGQVVEGGLLLGVDDRFGAKAEKAAGAGVILRWPGWLICMGELYHGRRELGESAPGGRDYPDYWRR